MKIAQGQHKAQVRADTASLVEEFLRTGGRVDRAPATESGNGYSGKDWARRERGLKVATGEEIEGERVRRALLAMAAKNYDLALALMSFNFDKEIKFDIEHGRLGPPVQGPDGLIRREIR